MSPILPERDDFSCQVTFSGSYGFWGKVLAVARQAGHRVSNTKYFLDVFIDSNHNVIFMQDEHPAAKLFNECLLSFCLHDIFMQIINSVWVVYPSLDCHDCVTKTCSSLVV